MPLPPAAEPAADGSFDLRRLPGGVSNTTHGEGIRRGVGYAVGFKNICFAEGFDDYSTARVRLALDAHGEPLVTVHTAGAEVGQGLTTLQMQIARTELGVPDVVLMPADTRVGSAGSSSASRQSYMTGGAVKQSCELVREQVFAAARRLADLPDDTGAELRDGSVVLVTATSHEHGANFVSAGSSRHFLKLADVLAETGPIEVDREFRHLKTFPLDPETGQGDAHVQFAFCVHRAVVDVDVDLGLVRVVQMDCAQDVGKVMNPQSLAGQIEGGTAQGLGLALMEEIQVVDGHIRNPSFTDYLIPTILDMPPVNMTILECADPNAPYGLRGVGEPPTISSTPAIVAALRAATGRPLTRVPVRPEHIVGV
jgi:CO/xanthine dehydrogenase Mo-binding subunit